MPHIDFVIQEKRLAALSKFQAKARDILVVTDVASRGLDIPHVDVVVNFDLPQDSKVSDRINEYRSCFADRNTVVNDHRSMNMNDEYSRTTFIG